jgi:hypothetical protein
MLRVRPISWLYDAFRIFALSSCLLLTSVSAYNLDGDTWSNSPIVLQLQLGPLTKGPLIDGAASWGAVAEDALALWNNSMANMKFTVVRDSSAQQARSNNLNNVFFSPTVYGDNWDSRVLAITLRSYNRLDLVETDVLFNSSLDWNSYRGNIRNVTATPGGNSGPTIIVGTTHDFRRVALHEFGHVLGLGHPDTIGQNITAQMNSAVSNLDALAADDIAGARALYDGLYPPRIIAYSSSQSTFAGTAVSLTYTLEGPGPFTYQWYKNGVALAGATGATLAFVATPADAGAYTVAITNALGTTLSPISTLIVSTTAAPIIVTSPRSQTLGEGQPATFGVVFNSPTSVTYQWRKNGAAIPGATNSSLVFSSLTAADAGDYNVTVTNSGGSVTSAVATLTVVVTRLTNLSVRTTLAANQILTVGFTLNGGANPLLIRAVGPGLNAFGVTDAMADPRLTLFKDGVAVTSNDNWGGDPALRTTMSAVGAFALASDTSLDAALLRSITGGHTVQVSGPTAGNVIVEAYDAGANTTARLVNLSALNRVGTGTDILIAGFTLSGVSSKRVLIRAIGPTLGTPPFNIGGVLPQPRLELRNSAGTTLNTVTNWPASLASTFASVGAFPLPEGSLDAAVVMTLQPGGYTVQVAGFAGATGLALIEIYEVP